MAVVVEWRRQPQRDPHSGSVEANGLAGRPFVYVHPQDQAVDDVGVINSFHARWSYSQNDAAEVLLRQRDLTLELSGHVSYESYRRGQRQWRGSDRVDRVLWRLGSYFLDTPSPPAIYRQLASSLQPSGAVAYEAWLSLDPAGERTRVLELTLDYTLAAHLQVSQRGAGTGSTDAQVSVFDHNGEIEHERCIANFAQGDDQSTHSLSFSVEVPPGVSVKVAKASVGLAYVLRGGDTSFRCASAVQIRV